MQNRIEYKREGRRHFAWSLRTKSCAFSWIHSSHAFLPEQTTLALVASNSFVMPMTASRPRVPTEALHNHFRIFERIWGTCQCMLANCPAWCRWKRTDYWGTRILQWTVPGRKGLWFEPKPRVDDVHASLAKEHLPSPMLSMHPFCRPESAVLAMYRKSTADAAASYHSWMTLRIHWAARTMPIILTLSVLCFYTCCQASYCTNIMLST